MIWPPGYARPRPVGWELKSAPVGVSKNSRKIVVEELI